MAEPFIIGILSVITAIFAVEARRSYTECEPMNGLVLAGGYSLAILAIWIGYVIHLCVK